MEKDKPSKTARKAALNIVTLGTKRGMENVLPTGIVDATAQLLVESGVVGRQAVNFSRSRLAVGIYLAFDWMMPGQFEAFAYRKAFCEKQVRKGIEAGARQVLVLGSGYDTLCWRLAPEFARVNFFEIDHPATIRLKAKGIEKMGQRINHHLIAEDLGKRKIADVLQAYSKWELTAQTVIVAEGLLMYLSPEAVRALFEQCALVTNIGSRFVFTYIGRHMNGRPDAGPWTWLVLWLLKLSGEPWLWSIQSEFLGLFLKETPWTMVLDQVELSDRRGIEFFGVAIK